MKKNEIVAPWGSWSKAMVAAHFGADAVYVWVPFLSLRMRQNKIADFLTLKKTIDDLHKFGKKAYLTINIFPRNIDINIIEATIEQIADMGADSVIFSDPWVYNILRKYLKDKINYHLSTQTNTLNYEAVKFWYDLWVNRIVLARELNVKEILQIKQQVPGVELEAFVHGAMCMTYSGRCLLGEYFAWRDWNKGECSHVCRYKFNVYVEEEKRPWKLFKVEEDETGSYLFSSKDLCTVDHIPELVEAIDAWKIEWRSKSELYVWSVCKAYSHARDSFWAGIQPDPNILQLTNDIPHRPYRDWFLFNNIKSAPEKEEDIVSTTTQTSAWPISTYQYMGYTYPIQEKINWKTYYKFVPKHNITVWDQFRWIDNDNINLKIEVSGLLDSNKNEVEAVNCNAGDAWICAEDLKPWCLLVR
jgi:U32 family peptidase